MRERQRGAMLIASLLIAAILLVAGIGLLAQRSSQARALPERERAVQALLLAQAGLEDCRIKFLRDIRFPPLLVEESQIPVNERKRVLSYTELVNDLDGQPYGGYRVEILPPVVSNGRHSIRCTGFVGKEDQPLAIREIRATFSSSRLIEYSDAGSY